jgi:hypothetical protein
VVATAVLLLLLLLLQLAVGPGCLKGRGAAARLGAIGTSCHAWAVHRGRLESGRSVKGTDWRGREAFGVGGFGFEESALDQQSGNRLFLVVAGAI